MAAVPGTGIEEDHADLAELVADVVERYALGADDVRRAWRDSGGLDGAYASAAWAALVAADLHAVHLPEDVGGAGGTVAEAAIILEQLSAALFPGAAAATFAASALCARAESSAEADEALATFARGASGALVHRDGLRAVIDGDDMVVSGSVENVLGVGEAEIIVARVDLPTGAELILFRANELVCTPAASADLTRGYGTVSAREVRVAADRKLGGVDTDDARALAVSFAVADATGIASTCVLRAVEHAQVREQFGRAIGSFQAMQHRLALMHVCAERARAAAWDAMRVWNGETNEQRELALAAAVLTALPAAVENALELVLTLGAMGFTWENDAHLLWRRALADLAVDDSQATWQHTLGVAAQTARRKLRLAADDTLPELRAEVREVLEAAGTPSTERSHQNAWAPPRASEWQRRVADARLVSAHLPEPFGRGADPVQQAVIAESFRDAGVAAPDIIIGNWVLPTIIAHGTDAQRERFVQPTLRGDFLWCQLFSEPGAGSDLAAVSTKAIRVDGGYRVTGQKVWNSLADIAGWGAALVRTDSTVAKHKGLSYVLIDMSAPGVEVRPIKQATGLSEFCEVFLTEVFVPDDCVVGEPGEGWKLASTTLANERLVMGEALGHGSSTRLEGILDNNQDDATRALATAALGRAVARESVLAALAARGAELRMAGRNSDSETSVLKLANIAAQREGSVDLMNFTNAASPTQAVLTTDSPVSDVLDHLGLPAVLLGGGTQDIQLGIIARKILGLR